MTSSREAFADVPANAAVVDRANAAADAHILRILEIKTNACALLAAYKENPANYLLKFFEGLHAAGTSGIGAILREHRNNTPSLQQAASEEIALTLTDLQLKYIESRGKKVLDYVLPLGYKV